jgi:hypothetical protein
VLFFLKNFCHDLFSQVLSFDPGNSFAKAELAHLDDSVLTGASINTVSAPHAAAAANLAPRADGLPSSMSRVVPPSSSATHSVKEPPSKVNLFKSGFLNPQPAVPKPRRIQIKEESEESDEEAVSENSAALEPAASSHVSSPLKPSRAAITAATAAAVAVTDEDILARAARIASLNVHFQLIVF